MSAVYYYQVFGLRIRSDYFLDELVGATPGPVDLVVSRAVVAEVDALPQQIRVIEFGPDKQYLGFLAIGRYLIRGKGMVDVQLDVGFDESLIGFTLLGPVIAVVLHNLGFFTLHGSAAVIGDGAAIFLGDKGAGKSTLAGAIANAGHAILTDDVVAIQGIMEGRPMLAPGYPMLKLTDASLAAFGDTCFELIKTNIPHFDKRRARLASEFPTDPVVPRAAYVLERGAVPAIEALSPLECYQALLRYSYATRFGDKLIKGQAAALHMKQCALLTSHMTISRLIVPEGLTDLPQVVSILEAAAQ